MPLPAIPALKPPVLSLKVNSREVDPSGDRYVRLEWTVSDPHLVKSLYVERIQDQTLTMGQSKTRISITKADLEKGKGYKNVVLFRPAEYILHAVVNGGVPAAAPTAQIPVTFARRYNLRAGGGPILKYLKNRELVLDRKSKKLGKDAEKLVGKLAEILAPLMPQFETVTPDGAGSQVMADPVQRKITEVEKVAEVVLGIGLSELKLELALQVVPVIGQITDAKDVLKNLGEAILEEYQACGLLKEAAEMTRPGTSQALYDRLISESKREARKALLKAGAKATTLALKSVGLITLGFGEVAVGAAKALADILARMVDIYLEWRRAELTNWQLRQCDRYRVPEDYYSTIRFGHPGLACFLVSCYSPEELTKAKELSAGAERVKPEKLKKAAEKIQKDLRWRMKRTRRAQDLRLHAGGEGGQAAQQTGFPGLKRTT